MSWNILPKNVLQYFLTKLKGLMYTKTEVDNLIPSITPNPSTTTGVLNGLEIDGTAYEIQGTGEPNVQADWDEVDSTADDYIKNKPTIPDISTKVSKSGDTMTGRLNFTFDTAEINFRQNHASYDGVISYQTAGNEAWLFTTKNAVTSIMFVNGEDTITNIANNRWQSLTPGLQIKNNKVAIGKLIANGTTPSHALDVSGTTNIEAGSDTPLRIKRNSDTGACYMGFNNNSGVLGYFAVLADKRPYFEPGGGSDTRIALWGDNISKFNNDSKYITGITKAMVTNALGYTPPTSDTNNKVEVIHSTSNAEYPIIFEGHNNQTTYTTAVYKTAYVTVNPYHAYLYVKHTSNGTFTIINSTGIYFRGNTNARIWCGGSQQIWIAASDESDYKLFYGVADSMWTFCPGKSGYAKLGSPNYKWAQIYSTSGSINTSDRKEKKDIVPLDNSAVDFIMALNPVSYKMINGDSGRTHYGMIAQDVEEELAELGMTAMDFAGFCKDQKRERYEEVVGRETITRERDIKGEYIYGLRYEEFIAPLIKTVQLQQEDINSLKEEISLLKEEIALLKQR